MKTLNFTGRFMSIALMLCMFFTTNLSAQKGGESPPIEEDIVTIDHHISIFSDDCLDVVHTYVQLYLSDIDKERVSTITIHDKDNPSNIKYVNEELEAELFNINQSLVGEKAPALIATVYSNEGTPINEYEVAVKNADDGMIDVTKKMDQYLEEFSAKKDTDKINLWFFFCDKLLSRVELFAFFQDYLDLTVEESCDMIKMYAQVFGQDFDEEIEESAYYLALCELFEQYNEEIGTGGDDDPDKCICKMIRTKSSAQSFHKNSGASGSDDCSDYDSYIIAEQHDSKPNDNDLSFSEGRQGAAKAAQLYLNYDGVDSSPDNWKITTSIGSSTIRFRSVCIDPVTVTANLEECETCDKEVTIDYGYFSTAKLFSATHACSFCDEGAKGVMEEYASVFVVNGESENEILFNQGKRYETECDWDDDVQSLDETLTDATALAVTIAAAIAAPSIQTIGLAAQQLVSFYENNIQEEGCDEFFFPQPISGNGSKTYILKPGTSLLAAITSGTTFGAKVINHGEVLLRTNSDFYLTGVVKSIPNDAGEVPDYCDCELLASYVVGSLDQDTPQIPNEDENTGINPKWNQLFSAAPLGLLTMRQYAGEIIGTSADWQGAFEEAGCCSVIIPCDSDCVFVRGCGDDVQIGYSSEDQNGSIEMLSELNEGSINVYPNPAREGQVLEITMLNPEDVSSISIMNISGKMIQDVSIDNDYNVSVNTTGFNQGIYIVVINFIDGSRDYKRVSIIK